MNKIIEIIKSINALPNWFILACFFFFMWAVTIFLLIRKDFPVKTKKKQRKIINWFYLSWCYFGAILGCFLIKWGLR